MQRGPAFRDQNGYAESEKIEDPPSSIYENVRTEPEREILDCRVHGTSKREQFVELRETALCTIRTSLRRDLGYSYKKLDIVAKRTVALANIRSFHEASWVQLVLEELIILIFLLKWISLNSSPWFLLYHGSLAFYNLLRITLSLSFFNEFCWSFHKVDCPSICSYIIVKISYSENYLHFWPITW